MKNNELVKEISERTNLTRIECEKVINAFRDIVIETVSNGEDIMIKGFVSFEITERKGRDGYNPYTGKIQKLAPVKTVKCKVSKPIKDAVKQ